MESDDPMAVWEQIVEALEGQEVLVNVVETDGKELIQILPTDYNGLRITADGTLYLDGDERRPTSALSVVVDEIDTAKPYPEGPEPADVHVLPVEDE